jgi:hypothetical protein
MPSSSRRKRPCCGCCAALFSVPIVGLLALFVAYLTNNRPPNLAIPAPTPPANNAYNDFVAAARIIGNIPHKAPASMPSPPTTRAGLLAASAACTKDAGPGLDIMRQGFAKQCQAPVTRTFADLGFQEMARFREVERTITGVRLYYELTNRPGKAADAALDGEELAVMFPRGGVLIDSLVGIACEAISLNRFEPLLPKLSKAELAHVAHRLDAIAAKRVPWSDVILEEGRSSTAMLQNLFRDPENRGFRASFNMVQTMMNPGQQQGPTIQEIRDGIRFVFTNKETLLREHLHYFERVSEDAKGPYIRRSNVPVPNNMFSQMVGGLSDQGRAKYEAMGTVLLLLRLEVAIHRYRADRGVFPVSLEQLTPRYIRVVPPDPFTGAARKPLHYSLTPKLPGFVLYSVGSDTADSGGRAGRYPDDAGFDIVAGVLGARRKEY